MGIPINGGDRAYFIAHPDTPAHALVAKAWCDHDKHKVALIGYLGKAREALDLPEVESFLVLFDAKGRPENLDAHYGYDGNQAVRARYDMISGKHGIRFRKKTDAHKRLVEALEGCPRHTSYQSHLLSAITQGGDRRAFGGPGTLKAPDGRYGLAVGTSMDFDGWVEKLEAAGFERVDKATYLRLEADVEETLAKTTPAAQSA